MSDIDSSKSPPKRQGGRIALFGAGATALALFNMSLRTEAGSGLLVILEYAALALGLVGLVGGVIMILMKR